MTQTPTDKYRKLAEDAEALAKAVDRHACDLTSGKAKWTMCIPPQSDDSDMLFVTLSRTTVPDLAAALIRALDALEECKRQRDSYWATNELSESTDIYKDDTELANILKGGGDARL